MTYKRKSILRRFLIPYCMALGIQGHLGLRPKLYSTTHGSWHPCWKLGLRPSRVMGANPMTSCLTQNSLGQSLKYILIDLWPGCCSARPISDGCDYSGNIPNARRLLEKCRRRTSPPLKWEPVPIPPLPHHIPN